MSNHVNTTLCQSNNRFATLDVLRGIAVLTVMALHTGNYGRGHAVPMLDAWIWPILRHGYLGVQLFFVISGYCIIGAVESAMRTPLPLRNYILRRFRRIYPPFWMSLVLAVALGLVTVGVMHRSWTSVFPLTITDWILNVVLLQGPFHAPDALMVLWSLSIEVQFYLLMAVCVLKPRWKSSWLVGVSIVYAAWAFRAFMPISGTPLAYWPEFACGIAAYTAHHSRNFIRGTAGMLWGLSAVAILLGWQTMNNVVAADGEFATPVKQLFCLGCGLSIWRLRDFDTSIDRSRMCRLIGAVGVASYSLYLTHVIIATRIFNIATAMRLCDGASWYAVASVALAFQFGVGWIFFCWCEWPWLNPGRQPRGIEDPKPFSSLEGSRILSPSSLSATEVS